MQQPTPTTRPRHALRWVLGVGLVFVVVVGVALQATRRRADERWVAMMLDWNNEWWERDVIRAAMPAFDVNVLGQSLLPEAHMEYPSTHGGYFSYASGGNIFRSWRESRGGYGSCYLVVRQERNVFGSSIEARLIGAVVTLVDDARAIFAAIDVELVVEP